MTGDKKFLVSVFLLILLILTGSAQNRRSKREWMTEGCWIKKRGGGVTFFQKSQGQLSGLCFSCHLGYTQLRSL